MNKQKIFIFTFIFILTGFCSFALSKDDELIRAAEGGNVTRVRQLLNEGAYIEARDGRDRQTALVFASNEGHLEIVRILIENKANINAQDDRGWTALSEASYMGRTAVVEYLLSKNASTLYSTNWHNSNESGNALFWCVYSWHNTLSQKIQIVKLLLMYNAEPEGRDKLGRDTIKIAEDNNYSEILAMLREYKAKKEKEKIEYQLLSAIREQDEPNVKRLLGLKANPNLQLDNGESLLNYAVYTQNINIVRILLESGANVNYKNLLGISPLMKAARLENIAIVNLLIDRGANINDIDNNGRTALFYAVENNNQTILTRLISAGISINTNDRNGSNVLIHACTQSNMPAVQYLLNNGARVTSRDIAGNTPLLIAAQKGNFDMVRFIMTKNADPFITNRSGNNALDYAKRNGNQQMIEYFERIFNAY